MGKAQGRTVLWAAAALALAVLAAALWGANDTAMGLPPEVDAQVRSLVLMGEKYTATSSELGEGQWAYLVFIDGAPQGMVLARARPDGGYDARVVNDSREMDQALAEYYHQNDTLQSALLNIDLAHESVGAFGRSRSPGEFDCRKRMGLGEGPCPSYDQCQEACYAAPECRSLAFEQGKPFLFDLVEFSGRTTELDAAMKGEPGAWETVRDAPTLSNLLAYRLGVEKVETAKRRLSSNRFFGGICPKPAYADEALAGASEHVKRAEDILVALNGRIDPMALARNTAQRLAQKAQEDKAHAAAAGTADGSGGDLPANRTAKLPKIGYQPVPIIPTSSFTGSILTVVLVLGVMVLAAFMVLWAFFRSMGSGRRE